MSKNPISGYDRRGNTPAFIKTVHQESYAAIDPTQSSLSAKGKTVFVTGGATGIGFSIARSFAAAGASTVVIVARRAPTLEEASQKLSKAYPSVQILTYVTDVANHESTTKTLNAAVQASTTQGLDILVTSAFQASNQALTLDAIESDLRGSFETNVLGNFHLARTFLSLPSSPSAGKKVILDVSTEGIFSVYPGTNVYGSLKYPFTFLMRHLQSDYPDKVRVHSFHPGAIYTPAFEKFGFKREQVAHMLDDGQLPGDFAVWLASEQAEFLKGRFVMAKWDVDELKANREAFEKDPTYATVTLKV